MKMLNLKISRKAVLWTVISVLTLGSSGLLAYSTKGFTDWNIFSFLSWEDDETSIGSDDISIKSLNTTNNADGSTTKTFSFSVKPGGADNQAVSATAKFLDGSECGEYIAMVVDNNVKTISVTTRLVDGTYGWSQPIVVTVVSDANNQAKATVTLEYSKKIISFKSTLSSDRYFIGPGWDADGALDGMIDSFSYDQMIDVKYSRFTKNNEFTYKCKDVSVNFYEDMFIHTATEQASVDRAADAMCSLLKERIESGGSYFTAKELWDLDNSNEWHSVIKSNSKRNVLDDSYQSFNVSATYFCVEDPEKQFRINDVEFILSYGYDYSAEQYSVGVSSIELESPTIYF